MSHIRLRRETPEYVSGDVVERALLSTNIEDLRVLVVDDGDTNRKLISLMLERCGATVRTADNGKVALQAVGEQAFDVILMDMQMPVLDGYSATRQLRAMGYDLPVIALTAHAMKGDCEKCHAAGCTAFLSKPINSDELIQTIADCVPRLDKQGTPSPVNRGGHRTEVLPIQSSMPIRSLLPTDDPEIREIVAEFIDRLGEKLDEMESALDREDFDALAELAHWLKGAGGTVGFKCFTDPASALEQYARESAGDCASETIVKLRSLERELVL